MNKTLVLVALGALTGRGLMAVDAGLIVSVDSFKIMRESKEGRAFAASLNKESEKFKKEVENAQKEIADEQQALNKQAALLSQDAIQEKTEALNKKRKRFETEFSEKEAELQESLRKRHVALREKQLNEIKEIRKSEKWLLTVDPNAPGVLSVADEIDKTDFVLDRIDGKYLATKNKASATKLVSKSTTTETKTAVSTTPKTELKAA